VREDKRRRLEAKGWKVGTAQDFLHLSTEELYRPPDPQENCQHPSSTGTGHALMQTRRKCSEAEGQLRHGLGV
jgi:hypothetical protein